jgi:hypothetical protein
MTSTIIKDLLVEVSRETDPAKALALVVSILKQLVGTMSDEQLETNKKLDVLHKIIVGNGDPTKSLVARMERIEDCSNASTSDTAEIKTLLVGDMTSADNRPSMLDRLRKLETAMNTTIKIVWMVLAVVIGQIVLRLMEIL